MTEAGEATTRILRLISSAYGVGTLVFGALAYSSIVSQSSFLAPVWTWYSIVLLFGGGLGVSIAATWASARTIRRVMAVIAIGYLVALATFLPALGSNHISFALGSPWILGVTALGTTAAALAWHPIGGVGIYLALVAIAVGFNRALACDIDITPIAIEDSLWGFCYDAIFASLALVSLRAGAGLDAAATSARSKVLATAETVARSQERARAEALVHDGVLATLLVASRESDVDRRAAAPAAARTLALLDDFRAGPSSHGLSPLAFVWKVQSLTTEIAAEAEFSYELGGEVEIPADVVRALSEAASEALRNSMRHADAPDRPAQRAVHVRVTDTGVAVAILDDGRGYDPVDISPTRMGVSVSIIGRMSRLEGGNARVASAPGAGTRILLEWSSVS